MNRNNMIKAGRAKLGYTQKEMANKMDMPLITYKKKENGDSEFKETEINKFLELTGESYEDIFMHCS